MSKLQKTTSEGEKSRLSGELDSILKQYPHLRTELMKKLAHLKEGN